MKKYDYLIVGAGLSGAVFADQARKAGKRCFVIDKRTHTGGNTYCEEVDGIHVHTYGAHIFHTNNERIWKYVNSFVEFNRFTNSPLAFYKGSLFNLPFNMNTFNQLWGVTTPGEAKERINEQRAKYAYIEQPANLEEQALVLCGEDIYYSLIKGYTEKQWGREARELPAFIIKRIPFRFIFDNNYFNDKYQGIPTGGYNPLLKSLLEDTEVKLKEDYFVKREYWDSLADKVFFTGCLDEFFDFKLGYLEYRSLRFENERLEIDNFQGNAVVNYTERDIPFTRIIEHKHFDFGNQSHTIITREYPLEYTRNEEPYYPVNDQKNTCLFEQYKKLAEQYPQVIFGGRLGQYAYMDMDKTIEAALNIAEREFS